jgi:enoyl-CoA hydratase
MTVMYEVAGAVATITIDRPHARNAVDAGTADELALRLADFPQRALRADRQSLLRQWSLNLDEAMKAEFRGGLDVIASGEAQEGARRFAEGSGRHGS